jgi:hypothetical protein
VGLSDELTDRRYVIVAGTEGYSHYIDLGLGVDAATVPHGSVIAIAPKSTDPKAVDRAVTEIAAANGGQYNHDIHLRYDATATSEFVETHVRRLEAIRRTTGGTERTPDGTWLIAPDHLERASAYEKAHARRAPVVVQVLSMVSLQQQVVADGATWLDQELVSETPTPLRGSGFGEEARQALSRRRQWLMAQDLAREEEGNVIYRSNLLSLLRRRELVRVGAQMSEELSLRFVDAAEGKRVEGTYFKSIDLVSGRFAVIEMQNRSFTLVPWRPVLDRHVGKQVAGIVREDGISWTIGRARGIAR